MLLLLVHVVGLTTATLATTTQASLCQSLQGECVSERHTCRGTRLESLCGRGSYCCLHPVVYLPELAPAKKFKSCPRTTKRCKKRGGRCVAAFSKCETWKADRLCAGSCTCCLGDHRACDPTPACRLRGGFCFRGNEKACRSGSILPGGCGGKGCSCCIPNSCSCGKPNGERIVGGWETKPNEYPWLVGLKVFKYGDKYFCGGTIISSRYILTAAHCLFNQYNGKRFRPKALKVAVGDHNQSSDKDDVRGVTRLVSVEKVIVHERYSFFLHYFDIGLVRLADTLDLVSHIQVRAACLPTVPDNMYEGRLGHVYGWGIMHTDDLEQPDLVREVPVPILNATCEGKTIGNVKITTSMLCAGEKKGGKDTCLGDSGGPLTVEEEDHRHTLVGITSFGSGCGLPESPGVYTRVTAYLEWILANTKDSSYCN